MQIEPYLFFDGRCEEALDFYKNALGAEVHGMMRFRDNPDAMQGPPGSEDKILHAGVRIGDATFMASDGHCANSPRFEGFGLALTAPDEAAARRYFGALENGGEVRMPIGKTFFSPCFGMVQDRFGVLWMITVP
jgi:PhnB protein